MPAEIIRARRVRDMQHVEIECQQVRWHLTIKPVRDFNHEVIGYATWLRRHNELHGTQAQAIRASCRLIEKLMGEARAIEVPDVVVNRVPRT